MKRYPYVSIIIPTYNEAKTIGSTIECLQPWMDQVEIVVVDGGSTDETTGLIDPRIFLAHAPRGRSSQMNAGARVASGDVLLFLHSDTRLPPDFLKQIESALADGAVAGGAFRLKIEYPGIFFNLATLGSNFRAALTGIYFGDQAIFARREVFFNLGGFPAIELMEDWEFSRSLRRAGKTLLLRGPVKTSARRWILYGKWRTAWLMHKIKLLYLFGVSPAELKKMYTDRR